MTKLKVTDVTLIAIDCTERINDTINKLQFSASGIDFGAVKLLSHKKPENLPANIHFEECPEIKNINDYNHYIFLEYGKHIDTSHCITIQDHGFIIHPELWDDNWLQYDYIGAPWALREDAYITPDTKEHIRVGNGGFSLRSKRLLEIPSKNNIPLVEEQGWYNEDGNICVYHRTKMLELGVKYAPLEVACRFSYETPIKENFAIYTFGFHKNFPNFVVGGK